MGNIRGRHGYRGNRPVRFWQVFALAGACHCHAPSVDDEPSKNTGPEQSGTAHNDSADDGEHSNDDITNDSKLEDGDEVGGDDGGGDEDVWSDEPILRRLTAPQFYNSVRQLLPGVELEGIRLDDDLAARGFTNLGAASIATSWLGVERYEDAAREIAHRAFAEGKGEARLGCEPTDIGDSCVQAYFETFIARAWRRPVSEREIEAYLTAARIAARELDETWLAIELLIAAVLQSPNFLYRIELVEVDPENSDQFRFDNHSMATRLAFLLTDTAPDDELRRAASRGELTRREGLETQLARLLKSEAQARAAVLRFFDELLHITELDHLVKDTGTYPDFDDELARAMQTEVRESILEFTFGDLDFTELFTTRRAYVNAQLAEFYGVANPADGQGWVTLPKDGPRRGLLTKSGIMAIFANNTSSSPTERGIFIRTRLLCTELPPPPDDIPELPPPDPDNPETARERLERHSSDPACAGCHKYFDPLGLALEHFDGIGQFRERDMGLELDVSGEVNGVQFDGALELGETLAEEPEIGHCLVQQFARHALATDPKSAAFDDLSHRFMASGHRFQSLLAAFVLDDLFRRPTSRTQAATGIER